MVRGEVRGTFVKDGRQVVLCSWVDAHENLLATELRLTGGPALPVHVALTFGARAGRARCILPTGQPLRIGCEAYVAQGRSSLMVWIDDVRVDDLCWSLRTSPGWRLTRPPQQSPCSPGRQTLRRGPRSKTASPRRATSGRPCGSMAGIRASRPRSAGQRRVHGRRLAPDREAVVCAEYIMACCSRAGKVPPGLWGELDHDRRATLARRFPPKLQLPGSRTDR